VVIVHFAASLKALTAFSAVAILVSGVDDLIIDVCYYAGVIGRLLRGAPERRVTQDELLARPEQAIAVMVPAWREDAVIARMLRNTLATVDYKNFDLFVGTYPNDEATMLAVAGVAESEPRVHRIVCPHDGPTNKADCLNWIIEGIRHHDKVSGKRADILMLHDSEDLIHPLSFKLMNRFIPEASMVQLPVIPFEASAPEMTAGTYLDEFAEAHLKDLVVRETLTGMVPSAGVGTGFSRAAIDRLAQRHDNQVFNVLTFTEDYDLAFRLKALGENSILLQHFTTRTSVAAHGRFGRRPRLSVVRELVGTRGYFPSNFSDAVRQKARWTLGIVFHGWQQRGWEGGVALRYMIWRDRKALVTNAVNILGYLLVLAGCAQAWTGVGGHSLAVSSGGWVWKVILIDGILLVNRCVQRAVCIARVYCWKQAALSLPRIVWGNVINFAAVARATHSFVRAQVTGEKLVWAKTAHAFPSEAQLLGYKRKLGDLLLESRELSLAHLGEALKAQKKSGRLLGDVLVDLGYVTEPALIAALAGQLKVESRCLDFDRIRPEDRDLINECASREHMMVVADAGRRPVVVAVAVIGDARMTSWLDANFPYPYRLVLAGRRNIVDVIDRASAERAHSASPPGLSPAQSARAHPLHS
jgi:adsorption protein B